MMFVFGSNFWLRALESRRYLAFAMRVTSAASRYVARFPIAVKSAYSPADAWFSMLARNP